MMVPLEIPEELLPRVREEWNAAARAALDEVGQPGARRPAEILLDRAGELEHAEPELAQILLEFGQRLQRVSTWFQERQAADQRS